MPRKTLKIQPVTVPQVKVLLESVGEQNLDQLQRRALDFSGKFSKVAPESTERILNELKEAGLDEEEAVQIINCMPKSIQELRVFMAGGRKIIETSKLEAILNLLNKYRLEEKS